ncbi:peptidoglycan/xylan/chitin deacetylase (PgdA/CDA1 family) [Alkalibacillus flavidus]|uniref:Peptidoglycan/xylan/chitin deacetylase (PgdA/CDA1 family) n=1 Tax=Alkalibacillus flavidus TaxID=546021 RepID=A0ABV2KQY3_9BACI
MKQWFIILMVGIMAILAACGDNSADQVQSEEQSEEEQVAEENEKDNDETESDKSNSDDESETEEQSNESEQESESTNEESTKEDNAEVDKDEEKETLYEMNNVWAFDPIDDAPSDVVLLTIDDGPDGHMLDMAKTLNDLGAKAIFFVNGIFMNDDESRAIVKQIHDMGFAIGNHTYGHENLSNLSAAEQRDQIVSLNELIEDVTGEKPNFFRAPHGINTDVARQVVQEEGMLLMNWSYGYDFKQDYMEKDAIADIMVNTELLSDGANLLMHDREWTNAALEDIVTGLRDKGYDMLDPDTISLPTDE